MTKTVKYGNQTWWKEKAREGGKMEQMDHLTDAQKEFARKNLKVDNGKKQK